MGQPEGRRLTAHQRQGVSEKSGLWRGKGGQCHHLMARSAGMTERQHGIFATAPEQDDARHGGIPVVNEGGMLPSGGGAGKADGAIGTQKSNGPAMGPVER